MSEDLISIEIDGKPVQARKGALLIEVTDAADIYIPRFCYHKKLSIAANCRMCLVEVEKAPKPVPACATPVMEGMKIKTRSAAAREAQRSTMEFLLINHPLDCPICDQGGECELQDLAMGYGSDVSRYAEKKRVVKDKNIGPLIQTDMTRCIHCTRCVRFGQEIGGIRELGATGRSEHMQIGTYIERAVTSELSGNVIDLCPVGALTSKPYRYSARAWELRQREGIAPHDSLGSNLYLHVKGSRIKRVVPRENEAVNEVWISDRDRYSYEGLYSEDRLTTPMIKRDGQWREADWDTALRYATAGLKNVIAQHGAAQLGALASATSTVEELYLFQKLVRGLGCANIDHRLRQQDFSDQDQAPVYPSLGGDIGDLERVRAALVVGSHLRKEHPLINHRLRKSATHGGNILFVNPLRSDSNFAPAQELIVSPTQWVRAMASVAKALLDVVGDSRAPGDLAGLVAACEPDDVPHAVAEALAAAGENACVLLGNLAVQHHQFAQLRALAGAIATLSGARFGYLPEAANSCGAWLAGALPHRGPAGQSVRSAGADAGRMLASGLKAYWLMGVEPELDAARGIPALASLRQADFVVSLTGYRTAMMNDYADVLLPMALFGETSGTYVNLTGRWQSFAAAVTQPGDSRPAWKILRVLGNLFEVAGFEYVSSEEVRDELQQVTANGKPNNDAAWRLPEALPDVNQGDELALIVEIPMHRGDALVRRAAALQRTADAGDTAVHMNDAVAAKLGVAQGDRVVLTQRQARSELPVAIDARVPDGCVLVYGAQAAVADYCGDGSAVSVRRAT